MSTIKSQLTPEDKSELLELLANSEFSTYTDKTGRATGLLVVPDNDAEAGIFNVLVALCEEAAIKVSGKCYYETYEVENEDLSMWSKIYFHSSPAHYAQLERVCL